MPQTYRVFLSPRALRDMTEIAAFIEKDSPQNAGRVAQRLIDAVESLDILPRRYQVHENRRDPSLRVHCLPEWPHLIYYRVNDLLTVVRIITVRDGRRRQPRRFRD